jgi:hypothetical protein
MRKTLVTLALAGALGIGTLADTGCNSAWWQNFKNDPVQQVQTFEAAISVATNAAQLAWPAILQAISAASQAQAQQQFTNALAAVNHAEQVLNDAVNAAVAAQQPNPDFTALMQAVSDAVAQVVAIVDLYSGQAPSPAPDGGAPAAAKVALNGAAATSVADMHTAYNSLSRWGVKIQTH